MIESVDENDAANKRVVYVDENIEREASDDMVVYEKVSSQQETPNHAQVVNDYPHGEIINAESGENIINFSQFMVDHELNEKSTAVTNTSFSLSPRLIINSDYVMST